MTDGSVDNNEAQQRFLIMDIRRYTMKGCVKTLVLGIVAIVILTGTINAKSKMSKKLKDNNGVYYKDKPVIFDWKGCEGSVCKGIPKWATAIRDGNKDKIRKALQLGKNTQLFLLVAYGILRKLLIKKCQETLLTISPI